MPLLEIFKQRPIGRKDAATEETASFQYSEAEKERAILTTISDEASENDSMARSLFKTLQQKFSFLSIVIISPVIGSSCAVFASHVKHYIRLFRKVKRIFNIFLIFFAFELIFIETEHTGSSSDNTV